LLPQDEFSIHPAIILSRSFALEKKSILPPVLESSKLVQALLRSELLDIYLVAPS